MMSRGPSAEASGAPRVASRDDDHVIATWRNLTIVIWRRETRVTAVAQLGKTLSSQERAFGGAAGLLMVVEENAPLPSTEARALSASVLKGVRLAFSAVIFEGAGFRAAAVRAVVTGIGLLARQPYPHQSFARVEDAAEWIARISKGQGQQDLSGAELIRVLWQVRDFTGS